MWALYLALMDWWVPPATRKAESLHSKFKTRLFLELNRLFPAASALKVPGFCIEKQLDAFSPHFAISLHSTCVTVQNPDRKTNESVHQILQ